MNLSEKFATCPTNNLASEKSQFDPLDFSIEEYFKSL